MRDMTRYSALILLNLLVILLGASFVYAQVGVGVNTGKISVDEPLAPGGIYRLPPVGVINTGQEAGRYEVEIVYMQDQQETRPQPEWFAFEPKTFSLSPGQTQSVGIVLSIPINARPGDYFALIEAHPVATAEGGQVAIAIAAATRLNFTIKPANIFVGVWYRVLSILQSTAPYSYLIIGLILAVALVVLFTRLFSIRIERR